jgi:hypothetical protein
MGTTRLIGTAQWMGTALLLTMLSGCAAGSAPVLVNPASDSTSSPAPGSPEALASGTALTSVGPAHVVPCLLISDTTASRLLGTSVIGRGLTSALPGGARQHQCVYHHRGQLTALPALVCTVLHLPAGQAARMVGRDVPATAGFQQLRRFPVDLPSPSQGSTYQQSGSYVGRIDFAHGDDFVSVDTSHWPGPEQARTVTGLVARALLDTLTGTTRPSP